MVQFGCLTLLSFLQGCNVVTYVYEEICMVSKLRVYKSKFFTLSLDQFLEDGLHLTQFGLGALYSHFNNLHLLIGYDFLGRSLVLLLHLWVGGLTLLRLDQFK
jgi:hypothetical protein